MNTLRKNTVWMLLGNGTRLLIQGVYFVLIARTLGSQQYGAFVAVVAAAACAVPFVSNGFPNLMIKHVSCDRGLWAESLGSLLLVTLVSGVALFAVVTFGCLLLLPHTINRAAIVMILASDLLVFPYVRVAGVAWWSLERLSGMAAVNVLSSSLRLVGIMVVVGLHHATLTGWAVAYLASSACASIVALTWVFWRLGLPRLNIETIGPELWEGLSFSVSLSAESIYNDIDKVMLAQLSTLEASGIYGAAYRLVNLGFQPILALSSATYPSFFREGKDGIQASARYGARLLRQALPYSICVAVIALICAPLVPRILGSQYAEAAEALRWLAVLPLLKTVHFFIADTLTGAGYQVRRTAVQVSVAVANVLINLWIIPVFGWRGAAWSSIASDGFLAIGLWFFSARLVSQSRSLETASALRSEPSKERV